MNKNETKNFSFFRIQTGGPPEQSERPNTIDQKLTAGKQSIMFLWFMHAIANALSKLIKVVYHRKGFNQIAELDIIVEWHEWLNDDYQAIKNSILPLPLSASLNRFEFKLEYSR